MLDNKDEGMEWLDEFSLIVEGGFNIPIEGESEDWCYKVARVTIEFNSTSAS